MKRVRILHGPNVSYIGKGREPEWYGHQPWTEFFDYLKRKFSSHASLTYLESPYEGQLIQWVWEVDQYDALILNPGALAHTSYALYDALRACDKPCIEVHYSQIYKRERFRQRLITARACQGVISGLGWRGYELALIALLSHGEATIASGISWDFRPISPSE
ncbi:MAG: type II 3-dehydroquinate dehydratase [Bacteroidia bacterium]